MINFKKCVGWANHAKYKELHDAFSTMSHTKGESNHGNITSTLTPLL